MAVAFSLVVLFGVPFAAGVAVASVRARWYVKLGLGASFPIAVVLVVIAGQPYGLIDVGLGAIAAIAIFGWLFGFGLSTDVRSLGHLTKRGLQRLIPS